MMKKIMLLQLIVILVVTNITNATPIEISAVIYDETPSSQKAILHDPALLRCVASSKVERCRWTWRPFESPTIEPLIVREFEAFGPNGRDCSVRFRSLLPEHEGEWTCAILLPGTTQYQSAPSAVIKVAHSDGVQFSQRPEATEVLAGDAAILKCEVERGTEVEWCRWTWRPLKQPNSPRIPVKEFPPFGNESRDCSVRFRAAQPEQSGEWSCGVRPRGQLNYQSTQPASLTVVRKEMQFVQLSQDLQVAAGETVLLRCVAASHVYRCRWLWRPFASADSMEHPSAVEVKNFAAFGNDGRDCSVRFSSVLPEQAGEWTCGVKPDSEARFQNATPARLNLLPAVKIRFVDLPEDTRVASGSPVTLPCSVTSAVTLCRWTWQALETPLLDSPQFPIEFAGQGNWSRDCSLTFNSVQRAHQGLWTCSVLGPPGTDTPYTASPVKLTVYQRVQVEFSELTQAIQMPSGSPVLLRCVTTQRVEKCRWIRRSEGNDTDSQIESEKIFAPVGDDSNDCSVRFNSVTPEQSGEWVCGVQPVGEDSFQDAPASRLTVLPQGILEKNGIFLPRIKAMTAFISGWYGINHLLRESWQVPAHVSKRASEHLVLLACIANHPLTSCDWVGPRDLTIKASNNASVVIAQPSSRLWAVADQDSGICSLYIMTDHAKPFYDPWTCFLSINFGGIESQVVTSVLLNGNKLKARSSTLLVLLTVIIGLVLLLTLLTANCLQKRFVCGDARTRRCVEPSGGQSDEKKLHVSKRVRFSNPLEKNGYEENPNNFITTKKPEKFPS